MTEFASRFTAPRRRFPSAPALAALLVMSACASLPTAPRSNPALQRPVKIGVALGGGGARGFAEIGVLRVLEQERIPIDVIVGTSVGSLIGALYADSGRVLDAEILALEVTEEDLFDYRALSIFSGGFVKGQRLEKFVTTHLKAKTIEGLRVPYAAVATELRTGRTVVLDSGPVALAVHASAAIPGVFVPVEYGGRLLVDGGVTNPVPADVARARGADVVIAVSIPSAIPANTPTNPIEVAYHAITIMAAEIGRLRAAEADVVITPEVGDVRYDDFSNKKRLIEAGELAARAALPRIRAAIEGARVRP